jgi:xanthine dehydrogenase accessory factor
MTQELQDLARALNGRGEAFALVTVVRAIAPTSAYPGAQAIVLADGTLEGWIGGGCVIDVIVKAAKVAIEKGEPKLVRISNEKVYDEQDVEHYAMSCASSGSVELFIQPNSRRSALCVLGHTPAADEARFLADRLRIRLTRDPHDARVVLIATQGQGDEEALEAALRSPAGQILMIASRRKADRLRAVMRMRGIGAAQLARLQAPAGPDAGAKTPSEIALVAIAGVLASLRGREKPGECKAAPSTGPETITPGSETITPSPIAPGPDAITPGPDAITPALGAKPGTPSAAAGLFINPVCGMAVSVANALRVEEHAGVSYYFCCDGCWTAFRKDPGKYAAIHQTSESAMSESPMAESAVPAGHPGGAAPLRSDAARL